MKKLIILTLIITAVCCNNPEDRATGNPESKNFNNEEKTQLNTAGDYNHKSTDRSDTSAAPATSKENVRSTTQGTNRSYGGGQDSGKQK